MNEIMSDFEDRMARMCELSRIHQAERAEFMATQPQTKPCKIHPEIIRAIDDRVTEDATCHFQKPTAGYSICPKCVEDEVDQGLKKYGVPEILIHARFKNYVPDTEIEAGHVEAMKTFCAKRNGFVVMLGGYGTGKTHLAVAALRCFKSGWIVKQSTILSCLRATYRDKAAFDPVERAETARLFILDDVGLSAGGRDELPLLHEILDYRHGEMLPTIITTNLDFNGLTNAIGERMADRLSESTFKVLQFGGKSHRPDAKQRYFTAEYPEDREIKSPFALTNEQITANALR
jgi:hypothetical protein